MALPGMHPQLRPPGQDPSCLRVYLLSSKSSAAVAPIPLLLISRQPLSQYLLRLLHNTCRRMQLSYIHRWTTFWHLSVVSARCICIIIVIATKVPIWKHSHSKKPT